MTFLPMPKLNVSSQWKWNVSSQWKLNVSNKQRNSGNDLNQLDNPTEEGLDCLGVIVAHEATDLSWRESL